jgi:hypothetical protein
MSLIGTQLHYHCRFTILPTETTPKLQSRVLYTIRRWLVGAVRRRAQIDAVPASLSGRWFFAGGRWTLSGQPRVSVETECFQSEAESTASNWAMRLEHPCTDERFRQWAVDIAVTPAPDLDGGLAFSLTTTHWMLPGYIGPEPVVPVPTAPGIVTSLMRSRDWVLAAGSMALSDEPKVVRVGEGRDFAADLTSSRRQCPIVYASFDPTAGGALVDCAKLARVLAGVAAVCVADAPELDDELPWLLPADLCVRRGTVRVYQTDVQVGSGRDLRRHRYFSPQQIFDLGPDEVGAMIVRGVARRFQRWDENIPASVDDIRRLARQRRVAELRVESGGAPTQAWVTALEEVNAQLETDVRDLRARVERAETQSVEADLEKQELQESVRQLERQRDDANQRAQDAHNRSRKLEMQLGAITSLSALPQSVGEVVERIAELQGTRLTFADDAKRSASVSRYEDIPEAWRCLWAVATVLHDLYFEGGLPANRIVEEFKARTGFDIALTEGSQTQKDKRLMALRRVIVDGQEFDVASHVKIGNRDPDMLRIHYAVDHERERIVIGHCGGHLATAGTRRKS